MPHEGVGALFVSSFVVLEVADLEKRSIADKRISAAYKNLTPVTSARLASFEIPIVIKED